MRLIAIGGTTKASESIGEGLITMSEMQFNGALASWWLAMLVLFCGCGPGEPKLDAAGNHFVEAQQALAAGDTEKAMEHLDASIAARPDPWAHFQRAKLHADAGDDEAAKQDCEAGLALDEQNSDLLWLQKELKKPARSRFKGRNANPPRASK